MQLVVSPSPGLGARGGGPLCLLPAATISVARWPAAARALPLICPFIAQRTIGGSLEGGGGAGRWKTKREQRHCFQEAKRQGPSFPHRSWPACPHQRLCHPRLQATCPAPPD